LGGPRRRAALLDIAEIRAILGRGRAGSTKLRSALAAHEPLLVRAASDGEERLIEPCEKYGIPLPELNVRVLRFKVDALWRDRRLIVEVDSGEAHGTPARMESDRNRDLALRAAGYRVVRYTWHQLSGQPRRVATDLLTQRDRAAKCVETTKAQARKRRFDA
jgi:hypothetical protein